MKANYPKINYHTQTITRMLGDQVFVLEVIRDLDEAIDQICDSMNEDEKLDPFAEDLCPYFGILWPAAEALSIYLNEHPKIVREKSVLELGCGLGFPSMVATALGGKVLATDFHPEVEEYFQRNCRHSSLSCSYQRLNWRDSQINLGKFQVVMGSDVLYESKHPLEVARGLARFVEPGGIIILSDPGRNYLQPFLNGMAELGFKESYEIIKTADKENFVFLFESY